MIDYKRKTWAYAILTALVFILYGNTISHQYALDDAIVVTQNVYTKQGVEGIDDILANDTFMGFFKKKKDLVAGGRYRPLSLVTFAIEYEFFGRNPHVSHFVNLLLYAIAVLVLYQLFLLLFREHQAEWYFSIPFIAALFYLVHPVHTEAVANIKGRDEIMALIGSLLSLYYAVLFVDKKKSRFLLWSGIAFFLGIMSKENTVTFLGIIPLTIFFFRKTKAKTYLATWLPAVLAFAVFFIIRQSVLGPVSSAEPNELMNNPFLEASVAEKYATIMYTLGYYIKLLFFPHPLTYDYYPYRFPIMDWGNFYVLLSLFLYIGLIMAALIGLKKRSVSAYGILFFLITISIFSNIVFPIGTFMNERFLFMPSVGFALVLGWFFVSVVPAWMKSRRKVQAVIYPLIALLLIAMSIKSISRNRVWKDDLTLFTTDVKTSYNSAKSTCSAGGKLLEYAETFDDEDQKKKIREKALNYLRQSVSIHPTYRDALLLLGNAHYQYNGNYDSTIYYYKQILKRNPNYKLIYDNIEKIFAGYNDVDHKIQIYEEIREINPDRFEPNYALGNLYGKHKNNISKAIFYLRKALKQKPNSAKTLKDLGVALGMNGKPNESLKMFKKALEITPDDPDLYRNIALTYRIMGETDQAAKFMARAREIKSQK